VSNTSDFAATEHRPHITADLCAVSALLAQARAEPRAAGVEILDDNGMCASRSPLRTTHPQPHHRARLAALDLDVVAVRLVPRERETPSEAAFSAYASVTANSAPRPSKAR
jgi:hypothetical protein